MSYDISNILDVPASSGIQPGTSLLVSGPAMTGTDRMAEDVLIDGAKRHDGTVAVVTNRSATDILEAFRDAAPKVDPARFAAIDCRAESDQAKGGADRASYRYQATDPSDVTGLGIGITNSLDRLESYGVNQIRLGLVSLSTMLTYTDVETVFKFCHVLTSRIDSEGYLGLFTIDDGAHDEKTMQVVKQPFDGMIQVRERDGRREGRMVGVTADPSSWVEL